MPGLPSLSGLRAFEATARRGSFTLAAADLHVTQAAVSRSVKALEEQLGFALFERQANRLGLTAEGRALLPDLTRAFEGIASAVERARQARVTPVLTVGAGPTFAMRWLIPRLARFHERHPDVEVHTTTAGPTALLRPEWTCSLRLGRDPTPGLLGDALFSPRMTPVCSPALARRLKSPKDLYAVTLLDVVPTADDWDLWLRQAGLDAARAARRQVYPFHAFSLQAALDGLGVAMGLHPYVIDDLRAGRLVAPFALHVEKPTGWFLMYRKESAGQPAFEQFRKWVRREARAQLP